jgi:hypothetical protein
VAGGAVNETFGFNAFVGFMFTLVVFGVVGVVFGIIKLLEWAVRHMNPKVFPRVCVALCAVVVWAMGTFISAIN